MTEGKGQLSMFHFDDDYSFDLSQMEDKEIVLDFLKQDL